MELSIVRIPSNSVIITIEIYPKIYYLYPDLNLHNTVFDKRKNRNVEVLTGNEIINRIRDQISPKQMAAIEKWLFEVS